MNRDDAEKVISAYVRPIFGFALKRCRSVQDAEDLSQEITLRAYRVLCVRDDIGDTDRFIWTIAHNMLANYYRDNSRRGIGVPLDEVAETLAGDGGVAETDEDGEKVEKLRGEIAYLSKMQRRIVIAYYFEGKRQADIANELGIPVGTVKWHLFEAKKELKRGMNTVRETSELKFNPIKFDIYGISGTPGKKSADEFFRSALSQNICYSVKNSYKTVNEIADDLGVSPVYVENEAEYLYEYGFLKCEKGKYICNFIIDEFSADFLSMESEMYDRAAELFANRLFDELTESGILDDERVICNQSDGPVTMTGVPEKDHNFMMWSILPYIAAVSGEKLVKDEVTPEEVTTVRPDGGQNIFYARIMPKNVPAGAVIPESWFGPMWAEHNGYIHWQVNSEWSDREKPVWSGFGEGVGRVLSLFAAEMPGKDDCLWLAENGYVKTAGEYDGEFKVSWQPVILAGKEIRDALVSVGDRIKEELAAQFEEITAPYIKASLDSVPAHLKKIRQYELQFLFSSDGLFLYHCLRTLVGNGKLKAPTEGQRKILSTMIIKA